MKGSQKVIDALNFNLRDELTAINQYIVHAELCENWGYSKLHDYLRGRAIAEMKHAEALIARIIFLEGVPVVSEMDRLHIGADVPAMMENDHAAEMGAIKSYNQAIILCLEERDHGTEELFERHLKDEEEHIDWIEAQQDQIAQMGLPNYLSEQID